MVTAAKKMKKRPKQQQQLLLTTRTSLSAKRPHFFKVLLGDFARRLRLPPRFVGDHLGGSSEAAVVHDLDGGSWDVALERTSYGAFLSGGWAKFLEDHALREHEFVVFRYDGDMRFTVVMAFDTTACEKDMVSGELYGESCLGEEAEEEEEDVGCCPETSLKKSAVPARPNKSKDVKHSGDYSTRQHQIRKELGNHEDPIPFLSTFPYFVSRMFRSAIVSPYILWLPTGFSRAHLPTRKTWMHLRDSDGNIWTVKCIPSGKGNIFSAGWVAFARDNNLQIGDYCAFELVAPVEFNITIIRAY